MSNYQKFLTVSQLNEYVKMLMESNAVLKSVWIRGEISNFKNHYGTGHLYFSLKDDNALLRAVMFRSCAQSLPFVPQNGMTVLAHGRVSAFVRDGQYQLYADQLVPEGVGSLYLAFEQLKNKLAAEGLFDTKRKKPLPRYPMRIGIITSPTGAAIQDMMNILGRRFPCAELCLYPALVQGPGASEQLASGIAYFNRKSSADVVIIGRGGGSAEDLWAFNDENLARCISESHIPVISAVGHESDFTICDFVADMRAPTPSAAAELAVPDGAELKQRLWDLAGKMYQGIFRKIKAHENTLKYLREAGVLSQDPPFFGDKRMNLLFLEKQLENHWEKQKRGYDAQVSTAAARLVSLNPLSVLSRGYSLTTDRDGNTIYSVSNVAAAQEIAVTMMDGRILATVNTVEKEQKKHGRKKQDL